MTDPIEHTIDFQFLPKYPLEVLGDMLRVAVLASARLERRKMFWLLSQATKDAIKSNLESRQMIGTDGAVDPNWPDSAFGIVFLVSYIVEANAIELRSFDVDQLVGSVSVTAINICFK